MLLFAQLMEQPQLGISLDSIDKVTNRIDSVCGLHLKEFTVPKKDSTGKFFTDTFQYVYSPKGQLAFLKVSHRIDSAYTQEWYYASNNTLLVSKIYIKRYMPYRYGTEETWHWGEECYFINKRMIHEISHGHGITETDEYDPEMETLKRFKLRSGELERQHITE